MNSSQSSPERPRHTRRIPTQSTFYDRILPIILIVLAIVMITLIVIAAGVLLGFVQYH